MFHYGVASTNKLQYTQDGWDTDYICTIGTLVLLPNRIKYTSFHHTFVSKLPPVNCE